MSKGLEQMAAENLFSMAFRKAVMSWGFTLFALVPFLVLVTAFLMISSTAGTFSVWSLPVHENGIYTFPETVFYYDHALRELPLDILLGVAIGAAAMIGFSDASKSNTFPIIPWTATIVVMGIIVVGTIVKEGGDEAWLNVFQYYTRPGADIQWGAHWYYHLLSRLSLILFALGLGYFVRFLVGGELPKSSVRWSFLVLLAFIVASGLFLGNLDLLISAFVDPIFLGHQARELVTHGLVTLPLSFAVCYRSIQTICAPSTSNQYAWLGLTWFVGATLLLVYVLVGALLADATSMGQSSDMRVLIFPHFFEHSFTYVITPLIALSVFKTLQRIKIRS